MSDTQTWYLFDKNTHGIAGLYELYPMTESDLTEAAEFGGIGPDVIIEGTRSKVIEFLRRSSCTRIETDDRELQLRCPEWSRNGTPA